MNVKTVAQALRRIKELKGKIAQTTSRMQLCVSWVEPGPKPIYSFDELEKERMALTDELTDLKTRLIKTNSLTEIEMTNPDGKISIQEAIFVLAEVKAYREFLKSLLIKEGEAMKETGEYNALGHPVRVPVKICAAIGLRKRDDLIGRVEEQISKIHEVIEAANHRTDLL
jgi:hypothetical protein